MTSGTLPSSSPDKSAVPTPCPVCRGIDLKVCKPGRDRLFGLAPGSFNLFRCKFCGCVFQNPLPDVAALGKFYPKEYWWSETVPEAGAGVRLFRALEKAYREFVIKDHVRFLAQSARNHRDNERLLLDIGCGNGTFLDSARACGFKPHGMDSSARAVEIAAAEYGLPAHQGEIGSSVWADCRFDFITMFHVLEHLPDPRIALDYARSLLKENGVLIIQVPNTSSLQAQLFGRHWYGLDVPRHVINFTPKALSLLLEAMGFEYQLSTRFSLRDNPASIASSLVPWLDPVRRKGRGADRSPIRNGLMEVAYLGVFLLSLPPAFVESMFGFGGTIWICARSKR